MILARITKTPGFMIFEDDASFTWTDTDDFTWGDADRIADRDYAGNHMWNNHIMRVAPIQWAMDGWTGGYVRVNKVGSIDIAPQFFSDTGYVPPPVNMGITLYYTATGDSALTVLLDGIIHRQSIGKEAISYAIYSSDVDEVLLLDTTTDYNGDTVPLPRAFGAVTLVKPVRVANVGGKYTFHGGYIASPAFYDDGVSVSIYADNGDGTFSLTNTPVGEVRMSGTGAQSTLDEIFTWATGPTKLSISYVNTLARSPSPGIIEWADTQKMAVDFLSDICVVNTHHFYKYNGILYLVDMATNNGTRTVTQALPSTYDDNRPVALLKSDWEDRSAGQFRAPGGGAAAQCVRETPRTVSASSEYSYGAEESEKPFHTDSATIKTRLESMLAYIHKPVAMVRIPLADLPLPGEQVTIADTTVIPDNTLTCVFNARRIKIDPQARYIEISGEGVLS